MSSQLTNCVAKIFTIHFDSIAELIIIFLDPKERFVLGNVLQKSEQQLFCLLTSLPRENE